MTMLSRGHFKNKICLNIIEYVNTNVMKKQTDKYFIKNIVYDKKIDLLAQQGS